MLPSPRSGESRFPTLVSWMVVAGFVFVFSRIIPALLQ